MRLLGVSRATDVLSILEDLFFSELAERFAFQPHGWDLGFLRLRLNSFSSDAFAANTTRQQPPFDACCKVTARKVTVFLSPPAPNRIATVHHGVLTASEQITSWRTILNPRQKQHLVSKTNPYFQCCSSNRSSTIKRTVNVDNKPFREVTV